MRYPATLSLLIGGIILMVSGYACKEKPYPQGETIYIYHCAPCHMDDGSGLAQLIPPLSTAGMRLDDPGVLVCLIRNGLPVNPQTGQQMLPNTTLSDVELTNLVNYLGLKYAKKVQTVQVEDVKKMVANCQTPDNRR